MAPMNSKVLAAQERDRGRSPVSRPLVLAMAMVAALGLCLAAFCVAMAPTIIARESRTWGSAFSVAAFLLACFVYVRALIPKFGPRSMGGANATATENPKLFELIRETQKKVAAEPPQAVFFHEENDAWVRIKPWPWRKTFDLHLGLGLVRQLTADEFVAVITHELVHTQQRRAWLLVAAGYFLDVLSSLGFACRPVATCLPVYPWLKQAAARERDVLEDTADQQTVGLVGKEVWRQVQQKLRSAPSNIAEKFVPTGKPPVTVNCEAKAPSREGQQVNF